MGYSRLGLCLLQRVQCIDALNHHIRILKAYFFADGVDSHFISPYDLGVPDEVEVLEAPLLHPQICDTLFESFIKLLFKITFDSC
jgi:hypothetical protein